MKLSAAKTDEASLSALGHEAYGLLLQHQYSQLAARFGYALSYGREPAVALEEDFRAAVASSQKPSTANQLAVAVKYFNPNSTGLFALVECRISIANEAAVLLELVVAGNGEEKNIVIEDISGVRLAG